MTWENVKQWQYVDPNWTLKNEWRPLPWYFGVSALGPFFKTWNRLERFIARGRGGCSHRCEFTDKQHGALYGGTDGPYMNAMFEQFIENITPEIEDART